MQTHIFIDTDTDKNFTLNVEGCFIRLNVTIPILCVILRFCILYVFAYSPKYIDIRDLFVIINTYSEYK